MYFAFCVKNSSSDNEVVVVVDHFYIVLLSQSRLLSRLTALAYYPQNLAL